MADAILDWSAFVDGDAEIVTGPQEAYRIKELGTDKTNSITPTISGNTLGSIRQEVAALQYTGTTEHGPLELEELYYYIPPETKLSLVRLVGLSPVLTRHGLTSRVTIITRLFRVA
jgi:hypothetical protein